MRQVSQALLGRNVPFYTQVRMAQNVVQGIKDEITRRGDVRLLLMGWPGPLKPEELAEHPVAQLLEEAHVDMAVFLNRGMVSRPKRVLVPFGGGIHSRLALRLALDLVQPYEGDVTALRLVCGIDGTPGETLELGREAIADAAYEEEAEEDELRDELLLARESIDTELGGVPEHLYVKAVCEDTIRSGILREATHSRYDLVVLGAALARDLESELFGSLTDAIAEALPTSVLLVRRYEPEAAMWLRRQVKEMVDRETEEVAEMPGSD
jgi:nucleotide-binding universal stress UspA family protein